MRVRLDLVAIAGLQNEEAMPQQEMLERLFEHIDKRIESVKHVVEEQTYELKRSQTNLLTKPSDPRLLSPFKTPAPPYSSRPPSLASVSQPPQGVSLVVASRTASCRAHCKCACHRTQKSATPSFLSRILGQLFVEHAGIPGISTKCDTSTCINAQASQVYAEYWFPLGIFWSQIIRIHATYQANLGPSFQLRTLRRVPDSAAAVSFAISGNIEGLQDLFRRGAASPQDVSDTRGYSLIRVRVTPLPSPYPSYTA